MEFKREAGLLSPKNKMKLKEDSQKEGMMTYQRYRFNR